MLNADDPTTVELGGANLAQVSWFSRKKKSASELCPRRQISVPRRPSDSSEIMLLSEIPLKGAHNLENVLAAVCVGMLAGCQPEQIRQAVQNFKAVEHRLEYVATVARRRVLQRLQGHQRRRHHQSAGILPGQYTPHSRRQGQRQRLHAFSTACCAQRVKRVYTIGAAAAKIESHIQGAAEIVHAETLENAVKHAAAAAAPGDIVLLAPACASFDQFQNYEHRGSVFKETVRSLVDTRTSIDARLISQLLA